MRPVGPWKLLASLGLVALPVVGMAAEVKFPLTVDYPLLQSALRKHLHEEAGGELPLWRSADGCRTLALREPVVEPADGRIRVAGRGSARAGFGFLGYCWAQVAWDGWVEIVARPEIGPDWRLHFRDLETELLDSSRQRRGAAGRIWDAVKGWAESELASFTLDLGPAVGEIRTLLGSFAGSPQAAPLRAALQSMRPVGVAVEPDGVKVLTVIDLPPAAPTPRAPEAALTPAELASWRSAVERWDGFLGFAVKDLGLASTDAATRDELLDLLLTGRGEILAVLARGPEPGADPVRALFLGVWERLRVLARRAAGQPGAEDRALGYLTFVAAGDALAALEAAAPAAGLEISADGLRRLARALDPAHASDPLESSEAPDPTMRRIFRFRDPDGPPRRPRRPPGGSWHWLAPRSAHAAEADEWSALAKRLDRWVPAAAELAAYHATVGRLLTVAAERSLDADELDERFDPLFYHLVQAVAWQESCWRQFVVRAGRVTYILSSTGDVGLMQINVRIWRGFFDAERLRWNAAYNAGAGAEILMNLLLRYGVREAQGRLENAARATYSAYNGGPASYRRYRQAPPSAWLRAVDRGFWEKYQVVAAGRADQRVLCLPGAAG